MKSICVYFLHTFNVGGWEGQVTWVLHDQLHYFSTKLLEPSGMLWEVLEISYLYSSGYSMYL